MRNSDFQVILDALRESIRGVHPNVDDLSNTQLMTLFAPIYGCDDVGDYGDKKCLCGHPIKFAYKLRYKLQADIVVEPIGSECIRQFSEYDCNHYTCLTTILGRFKTSDIWTNNIPISEFSVKNGFNETVMTYLSTRVLDKKQLKFLNDILHKRKGYMTEKQKSFMYSIFKELHHHYKRYYNNFTQEL